MPAAILSWAPSSTRQSPDTQRWPTRPDLARFWHAGLVVAPAAVLCVLGWRRRWLTDDALIVVRVVRQILAGNGPVFNIGERAEPSTSVLWCWLLAGAGLSGHSIGQLAMYGGLMLSVLGFGIAVDGTRRLLRSKRAGWLAPGGCLIVLALPPFWDFATSGLEVELSKGWLGLSWWLLVGLNPKRPRSWRHLMAFVVGLGVLVRPEFALVTAVFTAAAYLVLRPSRREVSALLATSLALPVAYQIFRAGYYGVLVPNTAIAKEASSTRWTNGWHYAENFFSPYHLWLPLRR